MPKGDKFQAVTARKMTLNIRQGNGASIVVKDGNAVITAKGRSCCAPKLILIREEILNATNN